MNDSISFWVSGDPKGQPRPRAFARKMGNKFVARVYDSGTAEGWKSAVAQAAMPHLKAFSVPVGVTMVFNFRRPKNHYNSKGNPKISSPLWHTTKPDADNAAKAVLDAMTQLGFWRDDSQVSQLVVRKEYACPGSVGAAITVEPLSMERMKYE